VKPAILMVDDVEANLISLEATLSVVDCDLVRARSGNEALRILLQRDFAVILLDVQMPDMDGYEVARLARSHPSRTSVPIIFLTARHQTEDVQRGYGTGAVDYLMKPFDPHVLRSKVSVFLELYVNRLRLEALAAELQHKNEALAATNAELEAFSYSVSHDLRAPLRAIEGFSQAVLEDYSKQLDEAGRDCLQRVRASAKRMSDLIDDLLALSRVTRAELHRIDVDLSTMAKDVAADLHARTAGRSVEMRITPGIVVEGDPGLLRALLENLIGNAWKFTSRRKDAFIEVGVAQHDGQRACFVRDNGVGFDASYASKLFRPFQRLHGNDEFEGTGIGLATVQRIVSRHGGRVWAEGAVDRGATIYFSV
jgi:two-component system, sensor histidine kinase and response regulator